MKKLALNLDDLSVESFEATPAADRLRGTVKGQEATYPIWNCGSTDGITQPATWCDTCHSGPKQCL